MLKLFFKERSSLQIKKTHTRSIHCKGLHNFVFNTQQIHEVMLKLEIPTHYFIFF